jgi:hypothetical protein
VAKHRTVNQRGTGKQRRARKALLTAAAAAGLSGTLVFGHALDYTATQLDPALAAAVFGVGGRGDSGSANVGHKLGGRIGPDFTVPGSYIAITYPADFNFQTSTNDGVATLGPLVDSATGPVQVTAYSEGTLVAEQVKRNLYANPTGRNDVTFLFIASPYVPNGGLFGRFPGFGIPGVVPTFSTAEPTDYDSTYVTNEYDPYADFPAYFNPLSLANSLAAVEYAHPDQYYDGINPTATNPNGNYTTVVDDNGAGGTDTYVLVYNKQLPLFGPIRQIETTVPELKPLLEPFVSGVEPLTRVFVDMGYTDRTNEDPATPTSFSLITPPDKVLEAAGKVPGAIGQGVQNFLAGHDVTPLPPSTTKHVDEPGGQPTVTQLDAPVPNRAPALNKAPTQDQPAVVPDPPAPAADQKPKTKTKTHGLDTLVSGVIRPNLKDGGKVSPTTKASPSGFGHGPVANLLKSVLGGPKSAPKDAEAAKPSNESNGASSPAA